MSTGQVSESEVRGTALHDRYYGLPEVKAESLRGIVQANIVRMLRVTDITARNEVRRAWDVISDLGRSEEVDSAHVQRVLDLVGGGAPRMPLLGKVWGIINLCEASTNFTPQQSHFRKEIWSTVREAIQTEPDETNISQMILLGAWLSGLAYREDTEVRSARFREVIASIDEKKARPENRYGMQVAAAFLSELLDADQLRLGILTVEIQGGDMQQPEFRGADLKAGYPDTMMILRQGAMHSRKKLEEGVSIGVPMTGYLVKRPLKVMVGLQRELLAKGSRITEYPDRRWSFITPGAYMHVQESFNPAEGEFVPDGLTLWVALHAIEQLKGKIVPQVRIRNAVTLIVGQVQRRIRLQMRDGSTDNVPGVLRSALDEWNVNSGAIVPFDTASVQLVDSALGLITAASKQENDGEILVAGRPEIFEVYKKELWESISLEDKLEFVRLLFREGSTHWTKLPKADRELYHLAVDPLNWDRQSEEGKLAIVQALFEPRTSKYADYVSAKQRQIMRGLTGEALDAHRLSLVSYDIKRVRGNMIAHLRDELTIKAETIRDKAGEPGEIGVVVFEKENGKA